MFDHNKTKKPIPPNSQHISVQSVALGVGVLLLLQTALLVALIFQQQGKGIEANNTPPDCIRLYGYNHRIPPTDLLECRPAPISIAQKV